MKRRWLILLCLLAAVACDVDDDNPPPVCSAPDLAGPYAAGTRDLLLDDPLRDEPLQARVAYPAIANGVGSPADGTGAPYPLVVISHGMLMYPATYDYLLTHLASHGFVVLGTKHQDSAEFAVATVKQACETIPKEDQYGKLAEVFSSVFEEDHPLNRPVDLSNLIDHAAALNRNDPILEGVIDLSRVGAVGHSFGAFTSLMLNGAVVDQQGISEACAAGPGQWMIDMMGGEALKGLMCFLFGSVSEQTMSQSFDVDDERVSAVVSIAGPVELIWGADFGGLAAISNPVLMVYTTTDQSVLYDSGAVPAYAVFNAPRYFLTLEGGTHGNFGYIDPLVFEPLQAEIPQDCAFRQFVDSMINESQVPALEATDQMRLTKVAVAAFLQHHLAGATGCEPYLEAGYYEQVDGDLQAFESKTR